jgi:hypothetical protein
MNTKPAQHIPADSRQSDQSLCLCHDMHDCPEQTNRRDQRQPARAHRRTPRPARRVPTPQHHQSATIWPTTSAPPGRDHPQPPHWDSYDANLLIDEVSFTAHALRTHRQEPLE